MSSQINKRNWFDYFGTFAVIGYSGITFFTQNQTLFILLTLFYVFRFLQHPKIELPIIIILFLQIALSILQANLVGNFSFSSFIGNLTIWIFPYLIFYELRFKFLHYFNRIIYWLSILSLIMFVILIFFPGLNGILSAISQTLRLDPASNESLIFYNVEFHRLFGIAFRNAGPFNESGTFGVILIVALVNNLLRDGHFNLKSKENQVFTIALLSTGSTGSYLALGTMLVLYFVFIRRNILSLVLLPIIIFLNIYAFNQIDFLRDKIEKQSRSQMESSKLYNKGRLGTALADLDQVKMYPFSGVGIYKENRIYDATDKYYYRGGSLMGIPALLARYGIPFAIFYLIYLFLGMRNVSKFYGHNNLNLVLYGFILIQVTWLGQSPYIKPLMIYFVFLGLTTIQHKSLNKDSKLI